ncbi:MULTISPECIES: carboxy terminal-processing peptidase [unclassified Sphingobacterium]|uniref:carboxy terminal-processing peptidase n=1 Tax=unclassified Sphingobacterium TaxID=2609468 RepID=UPI0010520276|nr:MULTISPECIES: carboxy terminal-processing peptidase [unclassified Sphingobacterium]MCS3556154.1 carboxyl-terminal processing protease [Sphingobacterium sp. JUb21]TCR08530.1 S41A family C-terminal processing peptidase-1 [Sphingobacterium sp. JUb20]
MIRNIFLIGLLMLVVMTSGFKQTFNPEEELPILKPTGKQEVIASKIAGIFENNSYKKVSMSDSLSAIVFDNLVKDMDEGHNYLLQSDVEDFKRYQYHMAQNFENGNLSAPFYMFNKYRRRFIEAMQYALKQIDVKHDYTIDESYTADRKELAYFKDDAAMKEQCRKRVKYDLLNLLLTDGNGADDKRKHLDLLHERYKSIISRTVSLDENDVFQMSMKAFTDAVDPHTSYFTPNLAQAFNDNMANTFEGIGASLQMENEMLTVKDILVGGPAFRDKMLQINDRIIGVAQGEGEMEDIVGWHINAAITKIKGPRGTSVKLKVVPAGEEMTARAKFIVLKRDKIIVAEESAKKEIKHVKDKSGRDFKIGLITLPKFYFDAQAFSSGNPEYKSTTRDVRLILDTLREEKVDAVVMDLRNNGGGSLREVIELSGLFIDKGPVVQIRNEKDQVEVSNDNTAGVAWDGPVGVLINGFSASASEIFAGVIQDYGRGVIMGSPSYGKGTVQSVIDMSRLLSAEQQSKLNGDSTEKKQTPSNGVLKYGQISMTTAKFYRVTGESTQHKGIIPDIIFPTQYPQEKFGESSMPSALPWDQIKPCTFVRSANLTKLNQTLNKKHQTRIGRSEEYTYLLQSIEEFKKLYKPQQISLNRVKLQKERDKTEEKNRNQMNSILKMRGLSVLKKGDVQPKTTFDFILDESLNIMTDLIRYKQAS